MIHDIVLYGGAISLGGLLVALPTLWSNLKPGKH